MFSSKDYRQRIGKIAQAIKVEGLDEVTEFYTNKINEVVKYLNDKMAKKRF
jgi:excinuclease UvrABC nuclease subunit